MSVLLSFYRIINLESYFLFCLEHIYGVNSFKIVYLERETHFAFTFLFAESGRPSEKSAFCAMLLHSIPVFPLYELSCFMFFLVPMVYIAVVYVKISLRIRRNNLKHNNVNSSVHGDRHAQTRKAVRLLSKFPSFPKISGT